MCDFTDSELQSGRRGRFVVWNWVWFPALARSAGAYTCNVPYDLIETLFQHPFNIVPSERLISCKSVPGFLLGVTNGDSPSSIGPLLLVSHLLAAQFLALEQLIDFARVSQLIVDS